MAFDTLTYAKKLQEAGVPPLQAEAHANALRDLAEDNLATKRDLADLEAKLGQEIKGVETSLRHEIELVRRDIKDLETHTDGRVRLQNWMIGFNLALTVAVLLKLLIT
jgi:hypothetical protein